METKTDMESDINLTVQPTMTVGEVQKEVEKRMGWAPTSQLQRCAIYCIMERHGSQSANVAARAQTQVTIARNLEQAGMWHTYMAGNRQTSGTH